MDDKLVNFLAPAEQLCIRIPLIKLCKISPKKNAEYFLIPCYRASALESEHTRLSNQVAELETSNGQLRIELDSECKNRKSETETLAKKLADSLKQLETAKQKVLDADNEVSVLKRKNQASLRELTRELKECQRRLEHSQTQNHLRISSPSGMIF